VEPLLGFAVPAFLRAYFRFNPHVAQADRGARETRNLLMNKGFPAVRARATIHPRVPPTIAAVFVI
jgi:hypothetical protein